MAAWVGVRGAMAYQHLSQVQAGAAKGVSAVSEDPASAMPALEGLVTDAEAAHDLTSDPVWALAEQIPWVGPQLAAFGAVAKASDDLLRGSLLPLATAAQGLSIDSLKPVGGRVDASTLVGLDGPAQDAASHANAAADAVRDIDRTPLVGGVASAVEQAGNLFDQVASAVDGLSRASQLLPVMLGQNGAREYLLLVQNNAEWRSLGGITGTAILLKVDNGSITLDSTQSATALTKEGAQPSIELPAEITEIYETKPVRYFHNLTQIPDFSVDGPIARSIYAQKTGVSVDGVFAVDPVVLSYLLTATGPVTLPTGDVLDSKNAVSFLLNGVYMKYPEPAAQDAVFAGAAGAVFQGLLDGRGSAGAMISALARAGSEHRFFMWSADPAEQSVISGTTIAGPLPTTDQRTAAFGVYLNDGTGSKMSYYVQPDVSIAWGACGSAKIVGERDLSLTITLTSDAPSDAATSLPWYITGGGLYGTPPGIAKVIPNVYLPEGFELLSAQASDGGTFTEAEYQGRRVLTFSTDLSPGASTTFTVNVRGSSTATEAQAFVTPTADASLSPIVTAACGPGS
ncbi:DUF4012 domain-containing protein [Microbacterium testaceum]|uniref:DUF4012 domain-containing protein n=1 Tax=Microbacterium testaceum TaxID=2033 RepID=UPI0009BFF3E8|nr:DUF4012 domain-containing protein [Microbacterium testaceum]